MEKITKDLVDENIIIFKEKIVNEITSCVFHKYIHNENCSSIMVANKKVFCKFIEIRVDDKFDHYLLLGYDERDMLDCKSEKELLEKLEIYKKDGYLTAR